MEQGARGGVSSVDAAARLRERGYNELPSAKPVSAWGILLRIVQEPMLILVSSCAVVYLMLGEPRESLLLLFSVILVIGITFFQERKAERSLEALRDLSSPRALVVRDGRETRIPGREVVDDDVILLKEGDRVPADARLISSSHLQVDESLLSGEAFPVRKEAGTDGLLYSGTLVIAGSARAVVTATGLATRMGSIGTQLREAPSTHSALQREVFSLVRRFAVLGAAVSLLIAVAYGLGRSDWPGGILAGLAAAIALLPEEFPVVLTVFLALGAWRIAQQKVLTRKISAIETLGTVSHLCVDKTGTLTLNQMDLKQVVVLEGTDLVSKVLGPESESTAKVRHLVTVADLASRVDAFDPMDQAIRRVGLRLDPSGSSRPLRLLREYPLRDRLFAVTQVWAGEPGLPARIAAKGAPEAIAELARLGGLDRERMLGEVQRLAAQGFRVLGVAEAEAATDSLPDDPHGFLFRFVGLLAFEDPVRPGVADAVAQCYRAGVRVIMMTGDYPQTASSIARQIGLKSPEQVLSGTDLRSLNDLELAARLREVNVFARVVPEQKLRIVNALKAGGAVVAMTGDGVNDAPALKWADIGIAMGQRGTDVARESSDLVLLNDDFTSIVSAIRSGRRIFDNIRKAISFIFAVHVPIAGMATLPVLLNAPQVLLPAHLVFLELIIDPAFALVFEAEQEEAGTMARPPRDPQVQMFTLRQVIGILAHGGLVLGAVFGSYLLNRSHGLPDDSVRAATYVSIVVANLALIGVYRTESRRGARGISRIYVAVAAAELVLLASFLVIPFFRELLRFGVLSPGQVAAACLAGIAPAVVVYFFRPGRKGLSNSLVRTDAKRGISGAAA